MDNEDKDVVVDDGKKSPIIRRRSKLFGNDDKKYNTNDKTDNKKDTKKNDKEDKIDIKKDTKENDKEDKIDIKKDTKKNDKEDESEDEVIPASPKKPRPVRLVKRKYTDYSNEAWCSCADAQDFDCKYHNYILKDQ